MRNHHAHLAGSAGIAIGHHTAGSFMGAVPEIDSGLGKQVGNRHKGRTDNPKSMFNPMHLEGFYKGFFGGHFHFWVLLYRPAE